MDFIAKVFTPVRDILEKVLDILDSFFTEYISHKFSDIFNSIDCPFVNGVTSLLTPCTDVVDGSFVPVL